MRPSTIKKDFEAFEKITSDSKISSAAQSSEPTDFSHIISFIYLKKNNIFKGIKGSRSLAASVL